MVGAYLSIGGVMHGTLPKLQTNATRPPRPKGLRNMQAKFSHAKNAWAFYFVVRSEDAAAGFRIPKRAGVLGTDQVAAQKTVDEVLQPLLEKFRNGAAGIGVIQIETVTFGTLDWLIEEYKTTRHFLGEVGERGAAPEAIVDGKPTRVLQAKHKNRLWHLRLISGVELKDGRSVGQLALTEITPKLREAIFVKLLHNTVWDKKARKWVKRKRRTTRNRAFRYARSAWKVVKGLNPELKGVFPDWNPFADMRIKEHYGDTPAASRQELERFVQFADEAGHPSIGTAALVSWEWVQRKEHVLGDFFVEDWRPKGAADYAWIEHPKWTDEYVWMPLQNLQTGAPLFADLVRRIDRAVEGRTTGPVIIRDKEYAETGQSEGWMTAAGTSSAFDRLVRKIVKAAGLREELSMRAFRNGGITELAEAECTDSEIRHYSRHISAKVLERYTKRTALAIGNAERKRTVLRDTQKHAPQDPIKTQAMHGRRRVR